MPSITDKQKKEIPHKPRRGLIPRWLWILIFPIIFVSVGLLIFEARYEGKVYPQVAIDGVLFGGKTPEEVQQYWLSRNEFFQNKQFELRAADKIATISAAELNLGYDATLSATQAYEVGRSQHMLSNLNQKFLRPMLNLFPYFQWNEIEHRSQKFLVEIA